MKITSRANKFKILLFTLILFAFGCRQKPKHFITENNFDSLQLADYVESDFPFITTSLDLRNLSSEFPKDNMVSRGIVLLLGDSVYACFDTDLLRWAVGWTGDFIALTGMAQISYADFFDKKNKLPRVLGTPKVATGIYPGWEINDLSWKDPREKIPENNPYAWGPIKQEKGRYEGLYLRGKSVILAYRIGQTHILEQPKKEDFEGGSAFVRHLHLDAHQGDFSLHLAEVSNGVETVNNSNYAYVIQGADKDTVTAIGKIGGGRDKIQLQISEDQYLDAVFSKDAKELDASIIIWKGPIDKLKSFQGLLNRLEVNPLKVTKKGLIERWPEKVYTKEKRSSDTAALVMDILTLPLPNPWHRNLRVMDIDFYQDGAAMVVTFGGDVWKVKGIGTDYMTWSRYASGFNEPMSIKILNGDVYVYDRLGITKLLDQNQDGEADFYKSFSNIMPQSMATREWPSALVAAPQGGFYIAKGGALGNGPILAPSKFKGFQIGSRLDGTVLWISEDGKKMKTIATGLRGPYIEINPRTGMLTASDQEGNFVPSTPVYTIKEGDYFGVPATAHGADTANITAPLLWLPHHVDPSGLGELWINSEKMGPLNHQLIHISYGRPGLFRILIDSSGKEWQGGANLIREHYPSPTSKGVVNPVDEQAYFAGFNLWGSRSKGISSLIRLRYIKSQPYKLPVEFQAGKQGVLLRFAEPLDSNYITNVGHYKVKRYNYLRTQEYGSGHYKLDGTEGEELLPVVQAYLSEDRKNLFLNIPNMAKVDQMEVSYELKASDENRTSIKDVFWLTVHQLNSLDLKGFGFKGIKESELVLHKELSQLQENSNKEISSSRGKSLFKSMGCIGCHSPGTRTKGKYGPPFQGLFGSKQEFEDGKSLTVDEDYIRESILDPSKHIVKGYGDEMPSFRGILNDTEIESLILYIKSLSK